MHFLQKLFTKKTAAYLTVLFLLAIIIISPEIIFKIRENSLGQLFINVLLIGSLLFIPFIFFYRKLSIYYILISIYCSLIPVLFLPLVFINERLSPEIIVASLNSNIREIEELLGWKLLLLMALMVASFCAVFYLTKLLPKKVDFNIGLIATVIGLLFFSSVIYIRGDSSVSFFSNLKIELPKIYPLGLVTSTYSIIKTDRLEDDYSKNTANFSFGSFQTIKSKQRTIEVLVIGESARYDHWSVNGYNRNTSPLLKREKNLITFSNVATAATLTLKAIPFLITRINVDSVSEHLKEKSLLEAFGEAGFYTAWISNQYAVSKSVAAEFHTIDADTTIYTNLSVSGDNGFMTAGLYDESLIEPFTKLINNTSTNLFIVVHTMGSHWKYKLRYPSGYSVFKPDNDSMKEENNSLDELTDEYDNSILYTDHIVDAMINKLQSSDAVTSLIYVADHGENLKDGKSNLMFHSATPNFYTAHIPLFIWISDSLKKQRPEIETALSRNKDKPVSTVKSIFYTALDMAGINIKIDNNLKTYSLSSIEYKGSEQQISGESNVIYSFKSLSSEEQIK